MRRLGAFFLFKFLNNIFFLGGGEVGRSEIFIILGYEDFVDIFWGVTTKLD